MNEFREELERRIAQFTHRLKLMHRRRHRWNQPCYIIFDEDSGYGDGNARRLKAAKSRPVRAGIGSLSESPDFTGDADDYGLPTGGWRCEDSLRRYVQFCWSRDWFCMDLPRQTLTRYEAGLILRDRSGFFYVGEQDTFTNFKDDVPRYDPFQKVYVFRDEAAAAEDMAWILFQLWKFPVDTRLYVTAFCDDSNWEDRLPID